MGLLRALTGTNKKYEGVYRESFRKTDAGLCLLTHPGFEIYDVNDSFSQIMGFNPAELTGSRFAEIWKKCNERDSFFTDVIRQGHAAPKERIILKPDNSQIEIVISGSGISQDMILITVYRQQ